RLFSKARGCHVPCWRAIGVGGGLPRTPLDRSERAGSITDQPLCRVRDCRLVVRCRHRYRASPWPWWRRNKTPPDAGCLPRNCCRHTGDLIQIARTKDAYVYENQRALPRVMFVTDWMLADFATLISTGAWPRFDPARTVLLETEPPAPTLRPVALSNAPAG